MNVVALTIWNPDAEATTSLHTTQHGAFDALVSWVEEAWDPEEVGCSINDESFPDNADMVDHFFDIMAQDYQYDMAEQPVLGPEVAKQPELGPDEVLLTPSEVIACTQALYTASADTVGDQMKIPPKKAAEYMYSAYKKLMD